jgi:membrane-bound lytic murein transglycosylase B
MYIYLNIELRNTLHIVKKPFYNLISQIFMTLRLLKLSFCFAAIIYATVACATTAPDPYNQKHFRGWLVSFSQEAKQKGISDKTIYDFLNNAEFLPKVIDLDRKQPDSTKTFDQYVKSVVTEKMIKDANAQLKENKTVLDKIGKKYKVQPRFIVALWAIESNFGKNTGGFSVINSLATLAYEGRRAEFFRGELLNALTIIDEGHINYKDMKGSWAGAMGQTQFMPSSYIKMAVDFNNDGKSDIWQTKADVFASIANYLSQIGWDDQITWGREVKLSKEIDKSLIGKTVEKSLKEWQTLGVQKIDGGKLSGRSDVKASLIKPESDKDRTYIVYSNYKTVLHWNRSLYFATAVGLLSDGMIK